MDDLVERLKQEAQIHAQEARTQRATVNEIYQLCTGATGEPGDWHGAEPVKKLINQLEAARAENERLRAVLVKARPRLAHDTLREDCVRCDVDDAVLKAKAQCRSNQK